MIWPRNMILFFPHVYILYILGFLTHFNSVEYVVFVLLKSPQRRSLFTFKITLKNSCAVSVMWLTYCGHNSWNCKIASQTFHLPSFLSCTNAAVASFILPEGAFMYSYCDVQWLTCHLSFVPPPFFLFASGPSTALAVCSKKHWSEPCTFNFTNKPSTNDPVVPTSATANGEVPSLFALHLQRSFNLYSLCERICLLDLYFHFWFDFLIRFYFLWICHF